jgi:hypothetical protein
MTARKWWIGIGLLFVVAACGGNPPTATPAPSATPPPSADASAQPSGDVVDEAFCGTVANLETALQNFEAIKIRTVNRSKLTQQAQHVSQALEPIQAQADQSLSGKMGKLATAVDGLKSATENFATSSNTSSATQQLKKAIKTLHTAINALRTAATCST